MNYLRRIRDRKNSKELYRSIFDESWYADTYLSSTTSKTDPFRHFITHGISQGLNPCEFFDSQWYLSNYADVAEERISPITHYMLHGAVEGRDPGPNFSTRWYLSEYKDVRESGMNPLSHYISHGRNENRKRHEHQVLMGEIERVVEFLGRRESCDAQVKIFMMQHQLKPNHLPFGYTAMGSDPQLVIKKFIPAGFFKIKMRLTYNNILEQFADQSSLEIFIGDKYGFRSENSWKYHIVNNVCIVDDVLFNPYNIEHIRLDPIDTKGSFQIEYVEIYSMDVFEAIADLTEKYRKKSNQDYAQSLPRHKLVSSQDITKFVRHCSNCELDSAQFYENWIEKRKITDNDRKLIQSTIDEFPICPKISVIMPVFKSNIYFLDRAIESIVVQMYSNWELVIVDDGSNSEDLNRALLSWREKDERIKVVIEQNNGGIARASNIALKLCEGEFIALVDHDDEIAPHAFFAVAQAINHNPQADMIYSDEDKIDLKNIRSNPFFKPDWSPEYFLSCMYTCHLGVYRRALVDEVGGFRSDFDFAQDYDLALRVSSRSRKIVHIPDVLYHWRTLESSTASSADAKPTAALAAQRAVQSAIDSQDFKGTVIEGPFPGSHRIKGSSSDKAKISIVIPTAARRIEAGEERWYLLDLLKSISKTEYLNYELVIVHNGDIESDLQSELEEFKITYVHYDAHEFNIAAKINLGVEHATGEYIVLLNDDMTIISSDWLGEMLLWLKRPGVAGVGAKLLFPDNTIQHAGVVLLGQGPSHIYYGLDRKELGLAGSAALVRNYSAVTGACLMVRKSDYIAIGGFDTAFRINYNDVDFCLRLIELGRIVYTPYAEIYHYESVSKGENPVGDFDLFNERWSKVVGSDPFYNVNLSQRSNVNEITSRPKTFAETYF
ncbi:hypothetical protein LNAOJCKE_2265 [Methylorubrum aminovorans]|uniref:Glycosyltransferase 2-like domain-containing protein n=1 Tax=Methylorubrum aminovorans TaxID=269069 RepID=A0ABQ4UD40_9HYPH|nr:glycosyltransferase [Methylorubrum aminovorans]GJE65057.1 hypothetical protein LNAOJCKE_2265 [Methylorubrum aminovorans]